MTIFFSASLDGFVANGYCYSWVSSIRQEEYLTWFQAKSICSSNAMEMLKMSSRWEREEMKSFLTQCFATVSDLAGWKSLAIFIGLHNLPPTNESSKGKVSDRYSTDI